MSCGFPFDGQLALSLLSSVFQAFIGVTLTLFCVIILLFLHHFFIVSESLHGVQYCWSLGIGKNKDPVYHREINTDKLYHSHINEQNRAKKLLLSGVLLTTLCE